MTNQNIPMSVLQPGVWSPLFCLTTSASQLVRPPSTSPHLKSAVFSNRLDFAVFCSARRCVPTPPPPPPSCFSPQIRLMNDFQKEVTAFWIRHPEK